jgi:kumamolisin
MTRMRKARLWTGIMLGVVVAAAPVALLSGPALAAGPGPNTPEQVASGVNVAALPGVTVFPGVPADTQETVSFILREQNLSQLEAQVEAGVTSYLSVSQFAAEYGQSQANISALTGYLASFGITSDVYADDVDVSTTGTAGEYDQALSVTQNWYQVPQQPGRDGLGPIPAQRVHGIAQAPLLPYRLSNFVLAIFGLTNYGPFSSHALHADRSVLKPQTGNSNACLALTGLAGACNLPQNFAANYGLDGLYRKGADGSGQTVAIVTLAALDPGAPEYFWSNIAHIDQTGTVTVDNVDGGPGAPSDASGTGETDLDVEQSGGVARGANVIVYQAPNTDPGFADAFFSAASQNIASSVSTSWGESETYVESLVLADQETAAYTQAFDEAFLEMAIQGQSGFDAAGDSGAYDATGDIGTTNLSVDTPADSPYLTSGGGTTLPWTGVLTGPDGSVTVTVPAQRTWGWDYLWQPIATVSGIPLVQAAEENIGGGGGGFSVLEPDPSYQDVPGVHNFHAVPYLTPTDYQTIEPGLVLPTAWSFNPTPGVITGYGNGRAVPDVSADADPLSGYLIYEPSWAAVGQPVLQGDWGGTSFVGPELNGSTAVIDSYLGHRVGFWNPAIYAAAAGGNSPFTPLDQAGTGNDNLYFTGNPGQPYNQAAGLGYPNLTELAGDFGS